MVFVTTFSATMRNEQAKKRHQRVQRYTGFIFKIKIFCVQKLWRENQVNCVLAQAYLDRVRLLSSVYLEGTRSHNEGRVSTPLCIYCCSQPRVRLLSVRLRANAINFRGIYRACGVRRGCALHYPLLLESTAEGRRLAE